MIKSIELRNWKTHKDTKMSFSKGINILIGQMGSGKSSLMDAISFALFGTFPAIQHKKVNVSRLIRSRPSQEKDAYVKLTLEIGGDEYVIKRGLGVSTKPTATIEKNGAYLQSQPERVTEEVERILKADYDLFSKAIYSEQNQLDYFLDIRPADRKKQIDGLLGLDKFAVAQDNATSVSNRLREMVQDNEKVMKEFDIGKASQELGRLKEEIAKLENDRLEAQAKIELRGKEKSDLEAKMAKLKEHNSRRISLAKEIEGIKSRMSMLDLEIKKLGMQNLPKKDEADSARKSLQEELEKLKDADRKNAETERKLHLEIAKHEASINAAKKDKSEKDKIEKELEGNKKAQAEIRLAECNESAEKTSTDIAHSRSVISDSQKQMKELEGHISKCPICERELDKDTLDKLLQGKEKTILEHKARLRDLESDLAKRKAQAKELAALIGSLTVMEEKHRGLGEVEKKMAQANAQLAKANADYKKIVESRDLGSKEINKVSESLQKVAASIEAIDRMERHSADKERLSRDLVAKESEHKSINVDEKLIDSIQSDLMKITSEISAHNANLASMAKFEGEKKLQAKAKEQDIERINNIHKDIARKKALAENITKFKTALAETQSVLRVQLINSINSVMHDVWNDLYPYGDYRDVALEAADDGYSLRVNTLLNGAYVWEDVESVASGGERSTACLAMRIAFSLVLVPNLKWLILDEPTHNIDREGIAKFVQMFSETLPGIIDQVFIITHDDMLKQVSNARIYMLNRNKQEHQQTEIKEV